MAPLPQSNTKRFFLDYSVGGVEHTLVMRTGSAEGSAAAAGVFEDLLTELSAQLYEITVLGMREAAQGSNLSFPVAYGLTTTFGSGAANDAQQAGYVSFVGRSSDGRRSRLTVYGNKSLILGGNFRATGSEVVDFNDTLTFLNANPAYFRSISGLATVWNSYANTGYNAYWRNKLR